MHSVLSRLNRGCKAIRLSPRNSCLIPTILFPLFVVGETQAVDPARPSISTGIYGKTVVAADGNRLRAAKVTVRKGSLNTGDPAFYQLVRDAGLNSVRVVFFDPYFKRHPWTPGAGNTWIDFNNPSDVTDLTHHLDTVVNQASAKGIYVILNCTDIGYAFDEIYFAQFWAVVAPRYKDRTHVLYELGNEVDLDETFHSDGTISTSFYGVDGDPMKKPSDIVDKVMPLFLQVRAAAPQTHISLFSLSATNRVWAPKGWSMLGLALDLQDKASVDWSKASFNFHNYQAQRSGYAALDPSEQDIKDLMWRVPVICGEVGFRSEWVNPVTNHNDPAYKNPNLLRNAFGVGRPLDGSEFLATQGLERLKISWAQWDIDWVFPNTSENRFKWNYRWLLNDAIANGYFWSDTWLPPFYYAIVSKHSNTAWTVEGDSNKNGARIIRSENKWSDYQRIRLIETGPASGWANLVIKGSGKSLEVSDASASNLTFLQQSTYGSGRNQQFAIHKVGIGEYKIISFPANTASPPKALDTLDIPLGDGANGSPNIPNHELGDQWHPICCEIP
jgi:hypothetical protein